MKRGVEFKGGSLHDGFGDFDGFGTSGDHLALLLLVLHNTGHRGNRDGFGGCGALGGYGGSIITVAPLKLNPLVRELDKSTHTARPAGLFRVVVLHSDVMIVGGVATGL